MDALVEFFAGLILALAASIFAHFGMDLGTSDEHARREPPSVQRSVLEQDDHPEEHRAETADCHDDCDAAADLDDA